MLKHSWPRLMDCLPCSYIIIPSRVTGIHTGSPTYHCTQPFSFNNALDCDPEYALSSSHLEQCNGSH